MKPRNWPTVVKATDFFSKQKCQGKWRKDKFFSTSGSGTIAYPQVKKRGFNPCFAPYTQIHSKWVKDLSVKQKKHKRKPL